MALSRPIGWLRDQRGDAVGLATADPLFQGGETKPTGYVATYSPVFTAEQVQQEIKAARADAIARLDLHIAAASKEASMALSKSALKRVIDSVPEGHDVGVWVVRVCRAVEAEVRKQDTELIRKLVEALENSHATLWEEEDDPERPAHAAIAAGRARLESKP